jgi:DHA1 family bicyclomycin/chloramphenicol resistance-like MFS transporter
MRSCCATRASWLLVLASGVPFNGMFLYVLSAPVWLGEHLQLAPHAVLLVLRAQHQRHHGRRLALGSHGRQAPPSQQIRLGFVIMLATSL